LNQLHQQLHDIYAALGEGIASSFDHIGDDLAPSRIEQYEAQIQLAEKEKVCPTQKIKKKTNFGCLNRLRAWNELRN